MDLVPLVREDIASNFIGSGNKSIESLYAELDLQNVKMLTNCTYNHHKADIGNLLAGQNSLLGKQSTEYEKILILVDFDVKIDDPKKQNFC